MSSVENIKPTLIGTPSDGFLEDNGLTFNEAGVTFNEAGVTFGGFYGFADMVAPMPSLVIPDTLISLVPNNDVASLSLVDTVKPAIVNVGEDYMVARPLGRGMIIGPGFFFFLTYPESEFIYN